ncbi:uncharacterized protein V1510DRAFT_424365 [Dipodascopsis tothii]|uniref:uncharacterized protein n=1 Tax=Dipodascopsis tothii TaxID=44089 RepID=UPI0034CEDE31
MSRNRAGGSRVRGPNSALTEFLRERGIDANQIRNRYEESLATPEEEDAIVTISGAPDGDGEAEAEAAAAAAAAAAVARAPSKRKKKKTESDEELEDLQPLPRRAPGQIDFCAECQCRFTVTVYSKAAAGGGLLCHSCSSKYAEEEKKVRKTQAVSRKRKKTVSAALLDKQEVAVPHLQDICIKLIAAYIDDVDVLGDIGEYNMDKIARILSRNRQLKNSTMKMFLNPALKALRFWDCSNLEADVLQAIGAFCPRLETLVLSMCGRLVDGVLDYYGDKLEDLHSLYLNGAFLVTAPCWARFLDRRGGQLRELTIMNTLRFTSACMDRLAANCRDTLETLALVRVDSLHHADVARLGEFSALTSLELAHLADDAAVTDDTVVRVLERVGPQLVTLSLVGCPGLTDASLEGVRRCGRLQNLTLARCESLTDGGVAALFADWPANAGLISVDLSRCVHVGDTAVQALVEHSARTLVVLNLNSVYNVTEAALQVLAAADCEYLSHLDVGFLKCINDGLLETVAARCRGLQLVEAYGVIGLTEGLRLRRGVRLVGRQSDSI